MAEYNGSVKGFVHSVETCGTVDGPGVRYVIFLQGCPLRCQYCHNPDTWKLGGGTEKTVDEIIKDVRKYKSFMQFSGGGLTVTGGEPLVQHEFVAELFKACHSYGIRTALDTSGFIPIKKAAGVLEHTDLVLLDLKSYNPITFKEVTGVEINPTLEFLEYLREKSIPTWIRFVLVPGLTDNLDDIKAMGEFLRGYENIEKVEVLPFHKMGEYKWEELGYEYKLTDTSEPEAKILAEVQKLLSLN